MPIDRIQSFAEFWPFYVREHRQRATRFWHFCGTTLALGMLAAAVALQLWWLLAAVPVAGYAFAWLSHGLIEKNRPATFSYPLWSLIADFKMWAFIVSGRMAGEVAKINGDNFEGKSP
jgi:hypothetical protein